MRLLKCVFVPLRVLLCLNVRVFRLCLAVLECLGVLHRLPFEALPNFARSHVARKLVNYLVSLNISCCQRGGSSIRLNVLFILCGVYVS